MTIFSLLLGPLFHFPSRYKLSTLTTHRLAIMHYYTGIIMAELYLLAFSRLEFRYGHQSEYKEIVLFKIRTYLFVVIVFLWRFTFVFKEKSECT